MKVSFNTSPVEVAFAGFTGALHALHRPRCRGRRLTVEPPPEPVQRPTKPPGDGWRLWIYSPPNPYETVEAWRAEWDAPCRLVPNHTAQEMNVAGLYWRPTLAGIDRASNPHWRNAAVAASAMAEQRADFVRFLASLPPGFTGPEGLE